MFRRKSTNQKLIDAAITGNLKHVNKFIEKHHVWCTKLHNGAWVQKKCLANLTEDERDVLGFAMTSAITHRRYAVLQLLIDHDATEILGHRLENIKEYANQFQNPTLDALFDSIAIPSATSSTSSSQPASTGTQTPMPAKSTTPAIPPVVDWLVSSTQTAPQLLNHTISDAQSRFLYNAMTGDVAAVHAYLRENVRRSADINIANRVGNTALMLAVSHGRLNVVNALLNFRSPLIQPLPHAHLDLGHRNIEGLTALGIAFQHGQHDIIMTLLNDPRMPREQRAPRITKPTPAPPPITTPIRRQTILQPIDHIITTEIATKTNITSTEKTPQDILDELKFDGDIPKSIEDPINGSIINHPIILPSGHTVDETSFAVYQNYQRREKKPIINPFTNLSMTYLDVKTAMKNYALISAINEFLEKVKSEKMAAENNEKGKEPAETVATTSDAENATHISTSTSASSLTHSPYSPRLFDSATATPPNAEATTTLQFDH